MKSRVQELAEKIGMSYDEFIGEMRMRGCSEPTAAKIWRGEHENFENFNSFFGWNLLNDFFYLLQS